MIMIIVRNITVGFLLWTDMLSLNFCNVFVHVFIPVSEGLGKSHTQWPTIQHTVARLLHVGPLIPQRILPSPRL